MGFERADCSFGFVVAVHVGRYLLELTLPDFGDVVEELGTDFIVHELHVHCESPPNYSARSLFCMQNRFFITTLGCNKN